MSIEINNDKLPEMGGLGDAGRSVAMGAFPTAMVGIAKAPMPTAMKVGALALGALFFGIRSIPHEHPPEFCHPETKEPLKKGDEFMHNGQKKRVVGYTGHHAAVFDQYRISKENGQVEVTMRDKPLWTGPYDLVAGSYGGGATKKTGLVLAAHADFDKLHRHDISGDGPFQSMDASQAVAISPKGQEAHDIVVVNPRTLSTEHQPGLIAQAKRMTGVFQQKGVVEGMKGVIDPRSVQILHDIKNIIDIEGGAH